jgi:hypothetical protein
MPLRRFDSATNMKSTVKKNASIRLLKKVFILGGHGIEDFPIGDVRTSVNET